MHLVEFKDGLDSGPFALNLLYKTHKIYIMDNHGAAGWCWSQAIEEGKTYNYFHIDRHYDLYYGNINERVQEVLKHASSLRELSVKTFFDIEYQSIESSLNKGKVFRYDNYLAIFEKLYPSTIKSYHFETHKDEGKANKNNLIDHSFYELSRDLNTLIDSYSDLWILNLDINYFFSYVDDVIFQILTDDYIIAVADEIKKALDRIEVITIALSPEFCGGWKNAERVAKLIFDHLELDWYK